MPQACWTRIPASISRRIMNLGAAEPPIVAARSLGSGRSFASQCWKVASHTVGTPALSVTPSRSIRSHSTAGSLIAEKTNLIPAIPPAKGSPQLAAWNIGTTGSITEEASKLKAGGWIAASACSTVERCS